MNVAARLQADAVMPWDQEKARVSRRVFTDPDIHAREIENIFNRSWLFLGHDSEIPDLGDYVVRPMGDDNVIVNRGEDGKIRAFLNSCRHRGMQLCRADAGQARRFVCPYHAWAYDTTGALRTTSYDQHYNKEAFGDLGLTPVAKLDIYQGLIFATWDPDADPLHVHLGDIRWYLDILFGSTLGGMRVMSPPQRWVVETNWKIPAMNFLDAQHGLRTHAGPLAAGQAAGAPPLAEIAKMADVTPQVTFPQGHGVVLAPSSPGLPPFFGHAPELVPLYEQALSPEQYAQFRDSPPQVGTIFPNTSWVQPLLAVDTDKPPTVYLSLRNWQPRGPDKVEIWSWYFAPAETSDEARDEMHKTALQTFGMGGVLEEDDAEVWASISRAIKGSIASREYMDFSAGNGVAPMANSTMPGTAYPSLLTEHAQMGYITRWKEIMDAGLSVERS